MTAVANRLAEALQLLLNNTDHAPDANCSCHITAPCGDCASYGGLREAIKEAEAALAAHDQDEKDQQHIDLMEKNGVCSAEQAADRRVELLQRDQAKPSPAGQGDASATVLRSLRDVLNESGRSSTARTAALNAAIATLAARQPDTDEQYADEQALIDHLDVLMDDGGQGGEKWPPAQAAIAGIIAARQPVGQVVAHRVHYTDGVTRKEISVSPWMDGDAAEFNVIYAAEQPRTRWIENAYAAPPAQVVDHHPWQLQLAESLDAFWNPALGAISDASYHGPASGSDVVGAIARGLASVAERLRENAAGEVKR